MGRVAYEVRTDRGTCWFPHAEADRGPPRPLEVAGRDFRLTVTPQHRVVALDPAAADEGPAGGAATGCPLPGAAYSSSFAATRPST